MSSRPARILFTAAPGSGHVHPMVPLARALRDAGSDVMWAVSPTFVAAVADAGFAVEPAGIALGAGPPPFDFAELGALPERERSTFIFTRVFAGVLVPPMLADLVPIVERFRPTVIVHEAAELAAAIAGAAASVPTVTHSLGPPMPAERMEALGDQVAGLWEGLGLAPRPYAGSYEHLYVDICPPSLRRSDTAHIHTVLATRPVPFAARGEAPPSWPRSCAQDPLVYVTFGTTLAARTAPVQVVVEAVRELPVRLLVTLGSDGDPATLGAQPDNVHVARFIAQTDVLGDCAAVVSHAGAGTMLAALGHGLPQLCLPQAADQFDNAEICAAAGAGIVLPAQDVSVDSVRAAVATLLQQGAERAGAERMAAEIAAMPSPEETARAMLEMFR